MHPTRRSRIRPIFITLLALAALGVLGAATSPRLDGRPLLLSPDLARSTGYLRFVSTQIETLQRSDAHLAQVLEQGDSADNLLDQARRARVATEDALGVMTAIEREVAPPELESLRLSLNAAASAYVEAGRLAVLFVNTPTAEAQAVATQALEQARISLQDVNDRWQRLNLR